MYPTDHDAEKAVLGACMISRDAYLDASEILRDFHFDDGRHAAIWREMERLSSEGHKPDLPTLKDCLDLPGEFVDGVRDARCTPINVSIYAEAVEDAWKRRSQIIAAEKIIARAGDQNKTGDELQDEAELELLRISEKSQRRGASTLSDALKDLAVQYEAAISAGGELLGVPSGFRHLDKILGGFQRRNLYIIAARPSMGKSALAAACIRNASKIGYPAALYSMEMGKTENAGRILSIEARVSHHLARQGKISEKEHLSIKDAIGRLDLPVFIDDTASITLSDMRSRVRRLVLERGVQIVWIDYLQLMHAHTRDGGNREQEVAAISRGLKKIAMELDIPVVALCQLNRGVESRGGDKRPQLSDLRESGAIEQDADAVCFIYRPEQYGLLRDEEGRSVKGKAEIIVGKQRNGPTGSVWLAFKEEYAAFENLSTLPEPRDMGRTGTGPF